MLSMGDPMRTGGTAASLGIAALTHAAVDAACAALLFGALTAGRMTASDAMPAFLGYGLLAFGTQPIIGFAADRFGSYRQAAVGGALVVAAALLLSLAPGGVLAAIVLAGLGNAAFHVGAGVFSLRVAPGRASAPGLFVAPGAAGLAIGTVAGRAGMAEWPIAATLSLLVPILAAALSSRQAREVYAREGDAPSPAAGIERLLLLVLFVVSARSFVGTAVAFPWRSEPWMLLLLTAAVVTGKALGGAAADRYGRIRVGVGTLLVAAPLLMLGAEWRLAGILGMLAFNVTMPITLVAVSDAMPGHPGTAFGFTCMALILGAFPSLVGIPVAAAPWWVVTLPLVLSAALLYFALAPPAVRARFAQPARPTVPEGSTL